MIKQLKAKKEGKRVMARLEGQVLGKYHILEPLGRGGMSQVYRAYHPQLDRYVAIKVLRAELLDEEPFMSRFRREAQAVAALRHPHIVQVHDFDVQDEISFMVMELLEGDTLKTRLNDYRVRGEQMPLGEVIRILLDVLDGLAFAHEAGMVHRDIKPANILLSKRGQAVLADFGIAQMLGQTRHTMSGALMGTLAYMAPEQGLQGTCDARSDLYSVGILLYEMLTQHPPYEADTPLAVLMKHLNDPLPLMITGETAVPAPFEQILLKALAKDPEDRYQRAEKMSEALLQAAATMEIDLPDTISPPLSFTTQDAPSESVAVLSGTMRQKLGELDTSDDATLWQTLQAEKDVTTDSSLVWAGQLAAYVIVGGNALAVAIASFTNSWEIFTHGWPFETFLVCWSLAILMRALRNIWFLIPIGYLFTAGWALGTVALIDNWDLWPGMTAVIVIGLLASLLATFWLVEREKIALQLIPKLSHLTIRLSLISAVLLVSAALVFS